MSRGQGGNTKGIAKGICFVRVRYAIGAKNHSKPLKWEGLKLSKVHEHS